jgi:hypothetical protein
MKILRALSLVMLLAPVLAACETQVPARRFPEISFAHQPPINLDVASIEVDKQPPAAPASGTVLYDLPVPLATVAETWANQRLKAVGQQGSATLRIEKATVVEEKLKRTEGFRGAFTTDQTERYAGELALTLTVVTGRGQGVARGSAQRARTVPEDATLAEREKLWFEMVEQLGREVDSVMEQQIRAHLSNFLR